mmetsp:Transcript_100717/g.291125  ORF Transcript_100717/g.291125 Transcript_100717/m.291125 type:complete len:460 (-) Transcript_100717:178-1557(-)
MAPLRLPLLLLASARAAVAEEQRVLFVGNSFSFVSGSVWAQYKTITEACIPGLHVSTTFKGDGGQTLHGSAKDPGTRAAVEQGDYDILVLQDQSELAEDGTQDVRNFYAPQAKKHGALVGLYETWATPDADGDNLTKGTWLRKGYYEGLKVAAESSGAKVVIARAGEAFHEVLKDFDYDWEVPGFLDLLSGDYDHPSPLGLNLVAWVMTMRFNNPRFGAEGCDAHRVPNVQGQSDATKTRFARIACELAYVCPRASAPPPPPKLCRIAQELQGDWVTKSKISKLECKSLRQQGKSWVNSDCTFTEEFRVEGTEVTHTVKGEMKTSHLRVSQYGQLCIVKLIPAFAYVARIGSDKVQFNDCRVWTRKGGEETPVADECWCSKSETWKDGAGKTCEAYGSEGRDNGLCESEGSEQISRFHALKAKQACSGCGVCQPPPPMASAAVRSLSASLVTGPEVELI